MGLMFWRAARAWATEPWDFSIASRATGALTPASRESRAGLSSPSARSSAARTSASSAPLASQRMRMTRPRSLALVATTSTMRLDQVRPRRIITAVEKALRTSFWAVPALSRVEPVMASGPVLTASRWSAASASSACGLAVTRAVTAPSSRARASAPPTKGVRPDAVSPTAMSPGRRPAASARPASTSSSTFSTARRRAAGPPAWWAVNRPSGALNVGSSSAASRTARRPDVPAPK